MFAGCKTIPHLIENTSTGLDRWRNCVPCVVERFSMNPLILMFLSLLSWTGRSRSAELVRMTKDWKSAEPGQFTGEMSVISGSRSLLTARVTKRWCRP